MDSKQSKSSVMDSRKSKLSKQSVSLMVKVERAPDFDEFEEEKVENDVNSRPLFGGTSMF